MNLFENIFKKVTYDTLDLKQTDHSIANVSLGVDKNSYE